MDEQIDPMKHYYLLIERKKNEEKLMIVPSTLPLRHAQSKTLAFRDQQRDTVNQGECDRTYLRNTNKSKRHSAVMSLFDKCHNFHIVVLYIAMMRFETLTIMKDFDIHRSNYKEVPFDLQVTKVKTNPLQLYCNVKYHRAISG